MENNSNVTQFAVKGLPSFDYAFGLQTDRAPTEAEEKVKIEALIRMRMLMNVANDPNSRMPSMTRRWMLRGLTEENIRNNAQGVSAAFADFWSGMNDSMKLVQESMEVHRTRGFLLGCIHEYTRPFTPSSLRALYKTTKGTIALVQVAHQRMRAFSQG